MKKAILFAFATFALSAQADFYHQMFIANRTALSQGKGCTFELAEVDSRYAIEWRYSDSSAVWMHSSIDSGKPLTEEMATHCFGATCTVKATHFQKNRPYYFAARQFIDDNNNGAFDRGEFTREWTPAIQIASKDGYIHACTFSN